MSSVALSPGDTHSYHGRPDVSLCLGSHENLSVTVRTDRLRIKSVENSKKYHLWYASLFGSQNVMAKYATGRTRTPERMKTHIKNWVERWRKGDPYSALAIFDKSRHFIGHIMLKHGEEAGQAELVYILREECWGQGYGSEAAAAVIRSFAPAIIGVGYITGPLRTITATARPDNPASVKILRKVGMQEGGTVEKFGGTRICFSIDVTKLMAGRALLETAADQHYT